MTDKQPEALKWADAVECAHMPQLAEFLRTQHAAIERKDALLRQALELIQKTRCDALYEQECEACNVEDAITKELQ